MANDLSAVLATRDMYLYYAPFAAGNSFPLDTVDFGTAWTTPWVRAGYTDGGVQANINIDRAEVGVDQVLEPVLRPITGRSITFTFDNAQMTVDVLNLSQPIGTLTSLAPAAGVKGHDTLTIVGGVPADVYNSWGFEALQQNGEPFRAAIWYGLGTGSPSPSFGQADTKAAIAFEISAIPDSTTSPERIAEFRNVLPAA